MQDWLHANQFHVIQLAYGVVFIAHIGHFLAKVICFVRLKGAVHKRIARTWRYARILKGKGHLPSNDSTSKEFSHQDSVALIRSTARKLVKSNHPWDVCLVTYYSSETKKPHLKTDAWNTRSCFLLGPTLFSGANSLLVSENRVYHLKAHIQRNPRICKLLTFQIKEQSFVRQREKSRLQKINNTKKDVWKKILPRSKGYHLLTPFFCMFFDCYSLGTCSSLRKLAIQLESCTGLDEVLKHSWGMWFHVTHRIHGTGIFSYTYHEFMPNVGKYTIHGSYVSKLIGIKFGRMEGETCNVRVGMLGSFVNEDHETEPILGVSNLMPMLLGYLCEGIAPYFTGLGFQWALALELPNPGG